MIILSLPELPRSLSLYFSTVSTSTKSIAMAAAAAAASISLTLFSSSSSTSRRHSVSSTSSYFFTTFYLRSPKARSFLRFATSCPSASLSATVEAPGKMPKVSDSSKALHFVKYQGLGNDFILVDNRESMEPKVTPEQAVKLCDRNFGVGADGVIFAMPGVDGTDYSMRIFNSDGSEPEMCGNGVRCFARFIAELETIDGTKSFTIQTGAGLIIPEIQSDGKVRVDMGQPTLKAPEIPTKLQGNKDGAVIGAELIVDGTSWNVTCVSMGNPHCITFGTKQAQNLEVDDLNLADIGPKFEHHLMFPARTNTEFIQVFSRTHMKMRVWERGAGATLACGTGACAVVVAAVLEGRSERKCTVDLPGGPLEIEWKEEDNHVYMTGPAEVAFYGSVRL